MKYYLMLVLLASTLSINTATAGRCFITISPCLAEPVQLNSLPPNGSLVMAPSSGQYDSTAMEYMRFFSSCLDSNFDINSLVPGFVAGPDTCAYDGFVLEFPGNVEKDTVIVLLSSRCIAAENDTLVVSANSEVVYPTSNDTYQGFPLDSCNLAVTFEPSVYGNFEPLGSCVGFTYVPSGNYLPSADTLNYTVCIAGTSYCSAATVIVIFNGVIPTLSEWGLIILTGLLLAFGARKLI